MEQENSLETTQELEQQCKWIVRLKDYQTTICGVQTEKQAKELALRAMLNLVRNNNSSKQAVELKSLEVEVNEIKHTFAELAMAYQNIKQRIIEQKIANFLMQTKQVCHGYVKIKKKILESWKLNLNI